MGQKFKVIAKVVSQKGYCAAEHKVGQEFEIGMLTPTGMCNSAYHAVLHSARVLRFGGSFPWSANPDTDMVACPDPENPVVFELRRVPE